MLKLFPTPKIEFKKNMFGYWPFGHTICGNTSTHARIPTNFPGLGGGGVRVDGHLSLSRGVGVPRHIFGNVL